MKVTTIVDKIKNESVVVDENVDHGSNYATHDNAADGIQNENNRIRYVDGSPGYQQKLVNKSNVTSEVIDCEVLFLTDSNLHRMNANIMNHGTKATKLFCPMWKDIEYVTSNSEIKRKPKQIYIQTLTNDIEREDFEVGDMCTRIKNVLTNLKDVIDEEEGEVIISSLCPRSDEMDKVEAMNKALKCLVRNFPYVKFMEQRNIEISMLKDRKHLDREGFTTLLANIRFALFGKLPRYFKKKPNNANNADRNIRPFSNTQRVGDYYTVFWNG